MIMESEGRETTAGASGGRETEAGASLCVRRQLGRRISIFAKWSTECYNDQAVTKVICVKYTQVLNLVRHVYMFKPFCLNTTVHAYYGFTLCKTVHFFYIFCTI